MPFLVLGLVLFLGVHSVSIVAPGWRDAQVARLGEMPWKAIYAVISLVGLVLLVVGYSAARQSPVVLYAPPTFLRHGAALLMLPVFPLLIATYAPGRIKAAVRHPMLLAVKFWALAHLLANGTLADVLLFGGFLVWAIADRISVKRRPPQTVPGEPASSANDLIAVFGGLLLYALFVWRTHLWLFGVSPLG